MRRRTVRLTSLLFCLLLSARSVAAQEVVFTEVVPFTISGTSDAPPGTRVRISIGEAKGETTVDSDGTWSLLWTAPLETGTYDAAVEIGEEIESRIVRVQLPGNVARQPGIE